MKFRTSSGFSLSAKEKRLLEWLCKQHQNGQRPFVFRAHDQDNDERFKQLEMSLRDLETGARRLEAWGREHWDVNPKCNSGTPPLRVEGDDDEIRLVLLPRIEDFLSAYNAWLESQDLELEGPDLEEG